MQNTVYECKQNGGDFFSSLTVTYFRFGTCPTNGLVTEQPQYSVIICIFSTWQNTEMQLISNGLHFIFTCSLSLAQPITFHSYRRTFATLQAAAGTDIRTIQSIMAHKSITTTQRYIKVVDANKREASKKITLTRKD